jgi:hypothetical protein
MKPMISLLWGLVLLVICHLTAWADISAPPRNIQLQIGSIPTTKSITQHGITWTFAEPVGYGQFVNGDYWVVDNGSGVKIVNITPGDAIRKGTTEHMNGSMINPQSAYQGYDGAGYNGSGSQYEAAKNVGIGVSPETPLVLTGDKSLVSTISNLVPGGAYHLSYVKTAAVLTCLGSVPPSGSFRPGISATTKTLHNISKVNRSLLKNLPCPTTTTKPDIATYAGYFQMVFLDHGGWTTRFMRPSDSGLDNYYFPTTFAEAELMLQMDYTPAEKESLLINSIQLGIDLYSFVEVGANANGYIGWPPDGGNMNGRKWPIMFAGIMLDYAPMRDIGQKSGNYLYTNGHGPGNAPADYINFGEDGQIFYVAQADVDITSNSQWIKDQRVNYTDRLLFDINTMTFTSAVPPQGTIIGPWNPNVSNQDAGKNVLCRPYRPSMIGMPEWAITHSNSPAQSDASWGASYRTIGTGAKAWAGVSMAIRIMGYKSQWNNPAFFDYMDRYMAIASGNKDPFGYTVDHETAGSLPSGLILAVWNAYRGEY